MSQVTKVFLLLLLAAASGAFNTALAGEAPEEEPDQAAEKPADADEDAAEEGFDTEAFIKKMKAEDKELELPPRTGEPIELSLTDSVELAIGNNFDLQIARLTPEISGADLEVARSEFDPTLDFDADVDKDASRSSGVYTRSGGAGIGKKLTTGADVRAGYDVSEGGDGYGSGLNVTITQPILRDFGLDVNLADIKKAENNLAIARSALIDSLMDTVAEVHRRYWDLVLAYRTIEVRRISLQQAEELLRENILRVNLGDAIKTDVLDARSQVASRRVALVRAEARVEAQEDALKAATNLAAVRGEDDDSWDRPLVPTTKAPFTEKAFDKTESISEAFDYRPDYEQKKLRLKNDDINLQYAKNQVYPQLDVSASAGISSSGDEMSDLHTENRQKWKLGAMLSIPLGNRSAKNTFRKRQLEKQQAVLELKRLEQEIILDVRRAIRDISMNLRRVKAARIAIDSAQANLDAAQQIKKEGGPKITTRDILQFQEILERSRLDYLNSVVEYNKALITLEQNKGTLLDTYNIQINQQ